MALTSAAQYSIDHFTVAGGGATSTNSLYSVNGTVGQAASRRLTGGSFSVDQGYWAVATPVQTPGSPLLRIDLASPDTILLSWLAPANAFLLEQRSAFPAVWSSVTNSAAFNSGTNQVLLPLSTGNRFYRLHSN